MIGFMKQGVLFGDTFPSAGILQGERGPFHPASRIKFALLRAPVAGLTVQEILDREVSVLVNEQGVAEARHGFTLTGEKESTAFGKALREQRYDLRVGP